MRSLYFKYRPAYIIIEYITIFNPVRNFTEVKEVLMHPNLITLAATATAVFCTILLSGCGGGSGDTPATSYTLPSVINAVPAQQ